MSLGERVPKLRFPGFEGEWEELKIHEIFEVTRGYVLSTKDTHSRPDSKYCYPVYSSQTKDDGLMGYYSEFLYKDAITWTTDGANAGTVHYRTGCFYCTNVCGVLLSNKGYANKCVSEILNAVAKRYVSYVGNPKLMNNVMREIPLVLPNKFEQLKISDFLSLLDSRIAAQRKLVKLLKKHKRGLSSVLFSGKVRVATNAKWRTYRLGDIVRRVTRKNGKATDIPLTISAQHGLIDQREFFSKAVASADMSGYYLLKQGEFAYNRSSSGDYPFGSIKKLERYHQGAVSTLYICFETLGDKDDAEFLKWYFDSFAWHREIGMICAEGARNHGLLNVPTDGFFDTKHILPSDKDERKKIASLMALADARCECAETELARLTAMKSGLLQQMFV